ncbi:MAG TPA: ATP-binding protein [Pyrinomonadaceae bacterium]|nr:ATP-binding protein [Pyrinomonadaceae bacterium]
MLDSTRARLTLWYTCVLALVLVVFAAATYAYLSRAARLRTDQSLADAANSLASNFAAETEDEGQTDEESAAEVTRDFKFDDRQAFVFDAERRVVAASAPPGATGRRPWPQTDTLARSFLPLLDTSAGSGRAYATVVGTREGIRAFAATVRGRAGTYTLVVARPLHDEDEELEQARGAFYVAVPVALLAASLGGYFLARKSLAPVAEMGERAARITASNLGERLPVANAQSELGRLAVTFNELLARLDLSFDRQRRFMADASHELRTPVAIVCGESEVALSNDARSADEYRESLSILHDEGRRLTRIVEDLFTIARADAGQYEPASEAFYLDETVGECLRAVRSLAARRGVEIRLRHSCGELPTRGDEGLVRRMILNLLDNAIKFTPPGGEVRVEVGRAGAGYFVSITDTGAGIPTDAQPHVFERFYRADRARARDGEAGGAGLGLSIASWIAESHGGRVALERSDSTGSTFVITLPHAR